MPASVSMSSTKKNKFRAEKCIDGDLDTVCTTKKKRYSTITIDFGTRVEFAKVVPQDAMQQYCICSKLYIFAFSK